MASEHRARDAAEALAARMGDGWEPSVFSSPYGCDCCGWDYSIRKGKVIIKYHDGPHPVFKYSASIFIFLDDSTFQFRYKWMGATPEEAFEKLIRDSRKFTSLLTNEIDQLAEGVS